jgi:predicted DNA-binding protein (MmcQ/YjbR family)
MTAAELKTFLLDFLGSEETFPFGEAVSVFKVGGKMFALTDFGESPLSVSLKGDPDFNEHMRQMYPAITPGYHLNKQHWNTVVLDGTVPDDTVKELIRDSYDLVFASLTKKIRALLDRQS